MTLTRFTAVVLTLLSAANALPKSRPFDHALRARQDAGNDALTVDLGYGLYQGHTNASTGINTWQGIRFAAPPTGERRWQRPGAPSINRTTISADAYGSMCPQVGPAPGLPSSSSSSMESEDCLFLNVQSPANASNLPVLIYIHGGGYGAGNGRQDFSDLLNTNGNNFVVVSIQYRLGPYGFLASDELNRRGVVNAGLLDQVFALQWVQTYIRDFGGNPSAVTISGESAGGGSVMLMDMAYGGTLGDSLFQNSIAASPYLPKQYSYKDWVPSQAYYAFASAAGCPIGGYGNSTNTIFDCLMSKDTATLQAASIAVTATVTYGTWAFLPVTDGTLVQSAPSSQLIEKRVNGRSLLVGNNANEGAAFTPQDIRDETALLAWLQNTLLEFTPDDLAKVLLYYPISNTSTTKFATNGVSGPSALDTSSIATGQLQRAFNIYGELTFVCPSYWMAEAYAGDDRSSYKYQYSPLPGLHADDLVAYFGPLGSAPYLSTDFQRAMMKIWGNYVTKSDPSISNEFANGSSNSSASANAASSWPVFSNATPYQLNLNQTGGTLVPQTETTQAYLTGPTLKNDFSLANAYTWEAGRGARCDFWRGVAPMVPA
ncbi:carboxylic ester hydrolase [Parastagonospora nodorum]|nr:carboxylic ester hydrolase [Parastagonospora nodorum]KAH4965409.1 carboxylic ester hydrolase [Parastagonospora nodorum]KAH5079812.1 carboxylic ester hydrolase [Parastagonospora nodorum]KAH5101547.1 carboxylic ester hydrolase [Parastagonospora nodorum]KAH5170416.1 carboxylic ester hydrolase [Parastagonospora nodorum]